MIRTVHHAVLGLALSIATLATTFADEPRGRRAGMFLAPVYLYHSPNPLVGGSKMDVKKNIVQNIARSRDHTALTAALQTAGLKAALEGKGPFTVFAPTNEAFVALPQGTMRTLARPENHAKLTRLLTYHVVAGNLSSDFLKSKVKEGLTVGADHFGGRTELTTMAGEKLVVTMGDDGKTLTIKDAHGNIASVTIADVQQSNGVIHVVNKVLMP